MKKTLVFALAALAVSGVARANYSLSTDITFASDYVFRGVQLADHTLHPSIEVKQDNWYLGYWGAIPINNQKSGGWIDEYDFYLGHNSALSDTVSLDVGATAYIYNDQDNVLEDDSTIEGYIGLTWDLEGFSPGVYTYYDFDLEALTIQGSIGYSIPMQAAGTSLDLSATLGWVDFKDADSYNYYGVSATVPYRLNDNATFTVGAHYSNNDLDLPDLDGDNVYFTAGLTIGF